MIAVIPRKLIEEFERSAAEDRRRKIQLRDELRLENDEKSEREHIKIANEEREFWEAVDALATPHQLADFNSKLENYDRATIEALMDNTRALDRVHTQIERLQSEAHVLPDGRRVYATKAGDAVFDETGARVGLDVIDGHAISAYAPKWDQFTAAVTEQRDLERTRSSLLDFQAKLDATRERSASADLSKKDLDDLEAELKATMPSSIAAHLPDVRSETADTTVNRSSDGPAAGASDQKLPPRSAPAYRP